MLPTVVATNAPIGQTPVLEHTLGRDHLSIIGGITPEGRLFTRLHERAIKSEQVIDFVAHLLACIAGKLLIIWDGATIHKSKAIKAFLSECHQKEPERLLLERLPGYSPELNPQEGIWGYLKYEEMPNLCCQSLGHLKYELILARERLRHKRRIIQACFQHAGCY